VDQGLAAIPEDPELREERRRQVLAGGYFLRRAAGAPDLTLVGIGALIPEVVAARDELEAHGLGCDALCLTSPDLIFRALRARAGVGEGNDAVLDQLFPRDRAAPIVTVHDGHPHTLAFLGSVRDVPITTLGVDNFGQSGDVEDLYRYFGIDTETIVGAAFDLVEEAG
jgi:pyruvate dehydrogenase E1 component